jgi:hypothetical protein
VVVVVVAEEMEMVVAVVAEEMKMAEMMAAEDMEVVMVAVEMVEAIMMKMIAKVLVLNNSVYFINIFIFVVTLLFS